MCLQAAAPLCKGAPDLQVCACAAPSPTTQCDSRFAWCIGTRRAAQNGVRGSTQCLAKEIRSPWVLQVMPQFTFACFCGLHGFCKMKRKKEEHSAEQETAV
ncbi:bladder cancer associated transcript 1 isoform X1 [Gallus gallus]|nr:bladder cancer associated transcript 1 isoform X1 [Gallus gallus]XP_046789090.1 bladder cancer associated transcript 1 isoform X1 [Gallus gallus]